MIRKPILAAIFLLAAIPALAYDHPLTFEANHGQFKPGVLYAARGPQYSVAIDRDGASLHLDDAVLRLELIGARKGTRIEPLDELQAKSSYFMGNDPAKWKNHIPNFARVRQASVWSGIDAIYYGNGKQLEYDLVVAPNADASQIALRFKGASKVTLESDGRLRLHVGAQDIWQQAPVVYQTIAGVRREVAARYVMSGRTVKLRIGDYDHAQPLVIDPVIVYSTYFGQPGFETYIHSTADAAGNVFITAYPGIKGPSTLQFSPGGSTDISVTKFAPDGQTLLFSIYFGGTNLEYPRALATDLAGNVYVLGWTSSFDFPVVNAVQPTDAGCDMFVSKISADGSTLMYSTYYGGSGCEFGMDDIAVDTLGQAVVTGQTQSTDFPVVNAVQPVNTAGSTGFVFKLNAAGNGIIFSTYFGSPTGLGDGFGVAADPLGNSYVVASTTTSDFPTLNAAQPALNGVRDGWIAKFDPAGALVYSTYFGGSGSDEFYGVAADASGNAYATGVTFSSDYATTAGAFQTTCGGGGVTPCYDAVVTKFDPSGNVVYSTFLGGVGDDEAWDAAIDATGRAVIVGNAGSYNFPLAGATQTASFSFPSPFVTRLSAAGDAIDFSTYHNGNGPGQSYGDEVALDAAGNIYASGGTTQSNFPMVNALFPTFSGGRDCWVAKWGDVVIITPSPNVLNAQGGANHKMVPVTLSYSEPSSARGMTEQSSSVCTVAVSSNEPVNGTGDGDTSPDWLVVDSHHVQLRAERAGNGNGRIYTINVTCPSAVGSTTVTVPKKK